MSPKPWTSMSRAEKEAAVKPLLAEGHAYSIIAWKVGAASRNSISTIAASLKGKGQAAGRRSATSSEPAAQRARRKAAAAKVLKPPKVPKAQPQPRNTGRKLRVIAGVDQIVLSDKPKPASRYDIKGRVEARALAPVLSPHLVSGESRRDALTIAPKSRRLALVDLGSRTCRWPYGDPRSTDFSFCGHEPSNGVYCSFHSRIAYQPAGARNAERA